EGVASASAVYTCLERETKVFFTFVSRSFLCVIIMKIVIFNSYNILSIKSKYPFTNNKDIFTVSL
ncbi:hypothetical protein BU181_02050, partial [Enterococcus faecium]